MTDDSKDFRAEVIAFLDHHLPPEDRFVHHRLEMMTRGSAARWQALLAQKGWSVPHWPREHGGAGWSFAQHRIWREECAKAGVPLASGFGPNMIGPILIARGTPEQQAEHLPPIVSGQRFWCQGYSEPGSGSDLASLRTRAVRDGDDYVVDGQKLWTTQAHWADWMFCLVRTDDSARPQAGITFLLIDMTSPGISVRPIRSIDGLHHLNEVWFDSVRVPLHNRIGEEGEGWTIAKQLLGHERYSIANVAGCRVELAQLRDFAARQADCKEFEAQFASLELRLDALAALESSLLTGHGNAVRGPAALKLLGTELAQDIAELGVFLAGPAALPMPDGSGQPVSANGIMGERIAANFLFSRAHTIYGGTSEVQRGLLARNLA